MYLRTMRTKFNVFGINFDVFANADNKIQSKKINVYLIMFINSFFCCMRVREFNLILQI